MIPRALKLNGLLATLLCAFSVSPAEAKDGWFGADKPGARALFYGEVPPAGEPPNAETIYLSLSCAKKGKKIVLFVAETSGKLKPGTTVQVVMSAAMARSRAKGKVLPNQLAGIPSIEAAFPLNAAVFAAMTKTATLRIRAGAWRQATPLKGIGNRLKTVLAVCRG